MRISLIALAGALTTAPAIARPDAPSPILTARQAHDALSYAKPQVARVTHVDLDLKVDFAARTVAGTAALDILARPGAKEIVLDDNKLVIAKITDAASFRAFRSDSSRWLPAVRSNTESASMTIIRARR